MANRLRVDDRGVVDPRRRLSHARESNRADGGRRSPDEADR
jgi:hypothetical protein